MEVFRDAGFGRLDGNPSAIRGDSSAGREEDPVRPGRIRAETFPQPSDEAGGDIAGLDWWLKETAASLVLHVRGDVDLVTAPEFARAVRAAIARGDRPMIIDLTQVDFMDGRGLRILEEASRDAPLTVKPSRLVRRLLEVVRLERITIAE